MSDILEKAAARDDRSLMPVISLIEVLSGRLPAETIASDIEHPEPWSTLHSSYRGNWRIYVPAVIQANWHDLSYEARLAVYLTALDQVRHEK